jgi:catechol 2,3-dioxygenase-like lactoylglutathione lyase family enzyme
MRGALLIALAAFVAVMAGMVQAQPTPADSPKPIRHALDHLVVAVRDLDAAKAAYERLGFTVSPPSTQPFGTSNRLVVFDTNFLELQAITDPNAKEPTPTAQFIQSRLRTREGAWGIGLTSLDIREDYAALKKRGAEPFEPFPFERRVTLPDGSEGTVSATFTGWFPERTEFTRLFYAQQLRPQYIWAPGWQRHANGATSLRGLTIVAEKPDDYQSYFEAMILGGTVKSEEGHLVVTTPSGSIEIIPPADYAKRYEFAAIKPSGVLPHVAAARIAVAIPAATRAYLVSRKIRFVEGASGSLVISPDQASGLLIEFVR